ncbi:MAG: MFS transporter [Proteobacteria bacterium]|nr:MFS transporter [Pseudomonadota bacterium]
MFRSSALSLKKVFHDLVILPKGIWGVGLANLFINLSTIVIFSLYSIYLIEILGVSPWVVGVWDGLLQAFAFICRIFSGMLSDYLRKRKLLLLIGYGFAALSRPLLAFSPFLSLFMLGHSLDRLGNGMQAAPRDALIGDIAPKHLKGECYGLRQTLAIIGSALGSLLTVPLMLWTNNNYKFLFLLSFIPAFIGALLIFWMVKEPKLPPVAAYKKHFIKLSNIMELSRSFWLIIGLSSVFTLARFGEAFLSLRGKSLGLETHNIPLIMLVMNICNSLAAYPFGRLSDAFDRRILLAVSFFILILSDLVLGLTNSLPWAFVGVGLWGAQIGATTSLILAMIADTARPELRATAFGIYYLITGLVHLVAGAWAGLVWEYYSPQITYLIGGGITFISLGGIAFLPSFKPKDIQLRNKV